MWVYRLRENKTRKQTLLSKRSESDRERCRRNDRNRCRIRDRSHASDEIIRGYEIDDGSYVLVDDDELEAIEPQKSREIDLREFVDLTELPPLLLERGYYLTPQKEATKAYRLLAEMMEQTRRAGIATFVVRAHLYMCAIFARDGILCAETLRFHDEIRDPATMGFPAPLRAARQRVAAFERSIDALFSKALPRGELADKATEALKALIAKKKRAGQDLIRSDHEVESVESDEEGEIDLLETIRRSLRHSGNKPHARRQQAEPRLGGLHRKRRREGHIQTGGQKSSRCRKEG